MKKILCFLTAILVAAASAAVPVSADDSVKVFINGEELAFDTEPVILNDRTMVPMRAIFESLGATVEWDGSLGTVTAVKGKNTMVLKVEDDKMYKNGEVITLEAAPVIIDGSTMIPLRAVSENLGVDVAWDSASRTASITAEEKEKDDAWKENTGTIDLSTKTAEGNGVSVNGNDIEIVQGGDFTITGSMTGGMIHVNTTDRVKLRLCGAQITNSTGPAIFFEDSDKGYLTISDGTENNIVCGAEYDVDAKAAIFSNDDLEIKGQGTLSVTSEGHHGIASDDEIEIAGATMNITAEKDGIHANDGIYITDGSIEITADGDGIQSDGVLSVTGGIINITTQGEVTASASYGPGGMNQGQKTQRGQTQQSLNGTLETMTAQSADEQSADTAAEVSSKGAKAGSGLYIGGGTINVSSTDHSIHSSGGILIADGEITLSSSVKKGISGHKDVTVNGAALTVAKATEGIESKGCLTVNGGDIRITCSDDGLNAGGSDTDTAVSGQALQQAQPSDGGRQDIQPPQFDGVPDQNAVQAPQNGIEPFADEQQGQRPGNGMGFGGGKGGGSMMYSADKQIIINGGCLLIDAQGDGIDSNGDLTVNGGIVLVNGPTSGGDGALDTNGTIYQNGGILIAVGSAGMMEAPGEGSAQPSVTAQFHETIEAGIPLSVQDSAGNSLMAFIPAKSYESVIFSSPQLVEGETYTVYKGAVVSGDSTYGYYAEAVCSGGEEIASVQAAFSSSISGMGGAFGGRQGAGKGTRTRQETGQEQAQPQTV